MNECSTNYGAVLQAVLKTIPESVFLMKPDGTLVAANENFAVHHNVNLDKILGTSAYGLLDDGTTVRRKLQVQQAVDQRTPIVFEDQRDGRTYRHTLTPVIDQDDNVSLVAISSLDLTETRRMEEELREFRARFSTLAAHLPGAVFQFLRKKDGSFSFPFAAGSIIGVFGTTPEAIQNDVESLFSRIHPDDRATLLRSIEESAEFMRDFRIDHRITDVAGTTRWMHVQSTPRKVPDGGILWDGVVVDITESKNVEEALRKSESRLVESQRIAHLGSYEFEVPGGEVEWSAETYRILGMDPYSSPPSVEGYMEYVHPEDRKVLTDTVTRSILKKEPFCLEYRVVLADGAEKHIFSAGRPTTNQQGEVVKIVGTIMDITERKRAEETVAQSEELLRGLVQASTDHVYMLDADGTFLGSNGRVSHLGFTDGRKVVGRHLKEFLPPRAAALKMEKLRKVIRTGQSLQFEHDFQGVEGARCHEDTLYPVFRNGKVWAVGGTCRDITEQKRLEEEQRRSIHILRLITVSASLEQMTELIVRFFSRRMGFEAVAIRLSGGKGYRYLAHKGFSKEFVMAGSNLCWGDVQDRAEDGTGECICTSVIKGHFDPAKSYFTRNGTFWTNSISSLLKTANGDDFIGNLRGRCISEGYESLAYVPLNARREILGLIQFCDKRPGMFTPRMINFFERIADSIAMAVAHLRAQEAVRVALEEKEVLLTEIHHRVKNNMQVTSSLLSLQAARYKDRRIREAIEESQGRIQAMAMVHESLYRSDSLTSVDLKDYIERLGSSLFLAYSKSQGRVTFTVKAESVRVGLDQAAPCGLVLNELLANSLRHAFPRGRKGEIVVEMNPVEPDEIEIAVADNGIGLPEGLDIHQTDSLGLRLVIGLVEKQLCGSVTVTGDGGTRVVLRWKHSRKK